MSQDDLLVKLGRLALARETQTEKKAKLDAARAAWEAEHADLISDLTTASTELAAAEHELRKAAEQHFADTGDKKPLAGIEVKDFDQFEVSPIDARIWCDIQMPGLLMVDMKLYEAVFESVGEKLKMPGRITTFAKATISRDLSAYKPAIPVVE